MVRLTVKEISKSFHDRKAVDNVSFEVPDGEVCAILGPSGCGKTTLLRLIAGFEQPDKGDIFYDGKSVADLPVRGRDIGMVFQGNALFPLMTVFENIAFPLTVRGEPIERVRGRVAEVAELLRIEGRLKEKPGNLSGGEQQRAALARAIVRKPKLFLMDEPLSSLDAPLRAEMRVELKRLHQKIEVTTVYVTHDQSEALALADEVGVMNTGSLLQYDSPSRIYSEPANSFVARFVGSHSTNLLPASLSSEAGEAFLYLGGLKVKIPVESEKAIRLREPTEGLLVSVRPEDIRVSTTGIEGGVEGSVGLVESLGHSSLLEIIAGEIPLKVVAENGETFREGQRVWVILSTEKMKIFDAISGQRVA
ncbi:MAG TPA: ABC transporter ATP-binding protein [Nitrososphaerales archaeon]|nr:ABC transporter ATP-binding protein [Nitrososphaerales archaeon]